VIAFPRMSLDLADIVVKILTGDNSRTVFAQAHDSIVPPNNEDGWCTIDKLRKAEDACGQKASVFQLHGGSLCILRKGCLHFFRRSPGPTSVLPNGDCFENLYCSDGSCLSKPLTSTSFAWDFNFCPPTMNGFKAELEWTLSSLTTGRNHVMDLQPLGSMAGQCLLHLAKAYCSFNTIPKCFPPLQSWLQPALSILKRQQEYFDKVEGMTMNNRKGLVGVQKYAQVGSKKDTKCEQVADANMVLRTDLNDRSLESPHDFATTCGVCYFDIPNVYFICEYCRPTRMDDPAFLCPNCYFQEEQRKKHTTICNKLYQDRKEYRSHKRTKQHDSKEKFAFGFRYMGRDLVDSLIQKLETKSPDDMEIQQTGLDLW
jgi:hypothetical protein